VQQSAEFIQNSRPTQPSIPLGWRPLNGRPGLHVAVSRRRSGPADAGLACRLYARSVCENSVLEILYFMAIRYTNSLSIHSVQFVPPPTTIAIE